MPEEIKINLEGAENILTIRHGEAPKIHEPLTVNFLGNLEAPRKFFVNRFSNNLIDKNKAVVTVDYRNLQIKLETDPQNCFGTTIIGHLKIDQDLVDFQINTQKVFTLQELIKFLRMRRLHFANPEAHAELISKLGDFTASITRNIEQKNDNRGNIKVGLEQIAKTQMPKEFLVCIPIFEGFENKIFKVEIFLNVRDAGIEFWFESIELAELLISESKKLIGQELEIFKLSEIVILSK